MQLNFVYTLRVEVYDREKVRFYCELFFGDGHEDNPRGRRLEGEGGVENSRMKRSEMLSICFMYHVHVKLSSRCALVGLLKGFYSNVLTRIPDSFFHIIVFFTPTPPPSFQNGMPKLKTHQENKHYFYRSW